MRKGRNYCLLVFCVLLVLTGMWYVSPARKQMLRPSVTVAEAETCNIVLSVYFKGTVCDESLRELYLAEPAYITGVYAEIGDTVKAGDVIMTARAEENLLGEFPSIGSGAISVFHELYGATQNTSEAIYCYAQDGEILVKSPIDGVISDIPVKSDSSQTAGTLCASVTDPDHLKIRASVPEIYIQDIEAGMDCKITGEAFRDRSYSGMVELIMPYATTAQTLNGKGDTVVEVLIGIDDPDDALRTGYNARVEIYTQSRNDALTVPYEAVHQDSSQREYVYVYRDGEVERRYIQTGAELETSTEVTSGLAAGELIVINSSGELSDGALVKAAFA